MTRYHTQFFNVGAKLKKQRRILDTRKSLEDAVSEGLTFSQWKIKKGKEDRKRAKEKKAAKLAKEIKKPQKKKVSKKKK